MIKNVVRKCKQDKFSVQMKKELFSLIPSVIRNEFLKHLVFVRSCLHVLQFGTHPNGVHAVQNVETAFKHGMFFVDI